MCFTYQILTQPQYSYSQQAIDYIYNEPIEKIMKYTKLSKEEIEKLAGLQLV